MPSGSSIAQFITVLILFVVVLGAAFFVTKWIASYQKNAGNSGSMEVIEACRIGSAQILEIVRIGSRYVVIAVGKDNVSMITELSPDEYSPPENKPLNGPDFRELLDRLKNKQSESGADQD